MYVVIFNPQLIESMDTEPVYTESQLYTLALSLCEVIYHLKIDYDNKYSWFHDLKAYRMPGLQWWNLAYVTLEQVPIKHLARMPVWNDTLKSLTAVLQDATYKLKHKMMYGVVLRYLATKTKLIYWKR